MKITDIRTRRLKVIETIGEIVPAWPGAAMTFRRGGGGFVEISTDEGITGIGPWVEPGAIQAAKAMLVGENPFAIEVLARRMAHGLRPRNYGGIAGFDIALWDIVGKASGQSLRDVFGGGDDAVTPYASLVRLSEPAERAEMAKSLDGAGWRAIKLRLHHEEMADDIATVAAVREAVGESMTLLVDANQAQSATPWQPGVQWSYSRALKTARELEQLGVFWLEEPRPRYAFEEISRLNAAVDIHIAGAENNVGLHEFTRMIRDDVYDVVQPECMVLGGLTTLRKIGTLAEAFGKLCVPHHGGGDIGVIAHLHLVASWTNAPFLELLHDPPIGDYRHRFEMFVNPPTVEDGRLSVPSGPGLGVEINPDWIEDD